MIGARIVNLFLLRGFLVGIGILALILAAGQSVEVSELVVELFDECVWRPQGEHTASYHPIYHTQATCLAFHKKLAIFLTIMIFWALLVSTIISSVVTREFSRRFALIIELIFVTLVPAFLTYRIVMDGIFRLDDIEVKAEGVDQGLAKADISIYDSIQNHPTALAFFILTLILSWLTVLAYYQISKHSERSRTRQITVFSLFPLGFIAASGAFFVLGNSAYQTFGALNLLLLFGVFLVGTLHLLALLGHRWHVPLLGIALTLTALQWAIFQRGESKVVLKKLDAQQAISDESKINGDERSKYPLIVAFDRWLASRADLEDFKQKGKPYPVYVLAVAGGGLHAALRTSRIIEELQSRCPAFLQHVFVVSAVSGGALGSAVVAGAANAIPQVKTSECYDARQSTEPAQLLSHVSENYLAQDFLPSILGQALFPDLVHRLFVPQALLEHPRFAAIERAKFFERVLANRWRAVTEDLRRQNIDGVENLDPSFFDQDIHSPEVWNPMEVTNGSGDPEYPSQAPGLVFNTTDADLGRIVPLSRLRSEFFRNAIRSSNLSEVGATLDVTTAVGISVRSPVILPAANVVFAHSMQNTENDSKDTPKNNQSKKIDVRLVDGGYADNSGIQTALDIVKIVRSDYEAVGGPVQFKIRMIYIGERASTRQCITVDDCSKGAFDPVVSAFLNTRVQSGNALIVDALQEDADTDLSRRPPPLTFALSAEMLEPENRGSAMGWLLSGQSRNKIKSEVTAAMNENEECFDSPDFAASAKVSMFYFASVCSLRELKRDLN